MTDTQPAGTPAADHATNATEMREWERRAAEQAKRDQWVAALRDGASRLLEPRGWSSAADALRDRACVIESGVLTPWADTPEPSTPPATVSAERPAGPDPHPGTPGGPGDGTGVLGRALLDREGNAWPANDREWAESERGPVREVLLVDPGLIDR